MRVAAIVVGLTVSACESFDKNIATIHPSAGGFSFECPLSFPYTEPDCDRWMDERVRMTGICPAGYASEKQRLTVGVSPIGIKSETVFYRGRCLAPPDVLKR